MDASKHVIDALSSQLENPFITVDIVLLTIDQSQLKVLLIQRTNEPFKGMWAIPGGFIEKGETLDEAALNRLRQETLVEGIYLEQLHAFGSPARDPRARVITVAYFAVIGPDKLRSCQKTPGHQQVEWFDVYDLPKLAFDHEEIVVYALRRLKDRLETTSIAYQLLPAKFTLTEMQRAYELILDKKLDKRNFRKKILASGTLLDIGETKMEGYHRPAQLFSFNPQAR
jgi:8-oxo-dGTP diphosphatase